MKAFKSDKLEAHKNHHKKEEATEPKSFMIVKSSKPTYLEFPIERNLKG